MSSPAASHPITLVFDETIQAVALEARSGLIANPRTLSPWLFYDEAGSRLFEQITDLPEYYLTRTERSIFTRYSDDIISTAAESHCLTLVELGAGTASKTGILLGAAVRRQAHVVYQPIDVSPSALNEAREKIESRIPGVSVLPQTANYVSEAIKIDRSANERVLALYIGSSIGNFSPSEARMVLSNLRAELRPGDVLLLGTDLAPGPHKSIDLLLAAYDDRSGVTAAFNRNILARLNRDLGANFNLDQFTHCARWNVTHSRIEMRLESNMEQWIRIPAYGSCSSLTFKLGAGETIHTENSYKFTEGSVDKLLHDSGFSLLKRYCDDNVLFAVNLASAR